MLRRLNEEELQVKQLLNALEDEKKHSKKVSNGYIKTQNQTFNTTCRYADITKRR